MRIRTRKEVIVETEEVTVVRWRPATFRAWCPRCNCEVQAVAPARNEQGSKVVDAQECDEFESVRSVVGDNSVKARLRCGHMLDLLRQDAEEVNDEE